MSILELGERKKKDIIFVSEDLKPDWWHQSSGSEFLPRFELVEEFKRITSGQTLHIINFSTLLKLAKASANAIEAAESAEEQNKFMFQEYLRNRRKIKHTTKKHFKKLTREEIIDEIKEWFFLNFEDPVELLPYESKEGGYIYIWGGPYDPREKIEGEFGGIVGDDIIDEVASEMEEISWEWSGHPNDERE